MQAVKDIFNEIRAEGRKDGSKGLWNGWALRTAYFAPGVPSQHMVACARGGGGQCVMVRPAHVP